MSTGRPTHFLSLPLGHVESLRNAVTELVDSFYGLHPPLSVDRRLFEPPVRLHVTCGVMRLADRAAIDRAVTALHQLRDPLLELLRGRALEVKLKGLGGFPEDSVRKTRVLFLRPASTEEGLLEEVADLLHSRFVEAGFITETRPLNLHCTLVKVPPTRKARFDILENRLGSLEADMGPAVKITEVHLSRMGSYDREGRHVSEGHMSFSGDGSVLGGLSLGVAEPERNKGPFD